LAIEFVETAPPVPQTVPSPYSGQQIDLPGSLNYDVLLRPQIDNGTVLTLQSPTRGAPWKADGVKLDRRR
jgi:hypothetical protein